MTEIELQQLRRERWRLNGKPVRTIEQARTFIETAGFCLMYPLRTAIPVPTFIGAFVGSDERLPTWQQAYSDPRAAEATELMVRLLRERTAYEANLFEEDHTSNNAFLVAASVFPFFYALVGERNPKQAPKRGSRSPYSALACDAFELIRNDGPISKLKLQEALGGSVSIAALDKALAELLGKLRITRVDYKQSEGSFWDVLYRWAPEAVKEGVRLSVQQALSGLLSKYLDCVVAAEPAELESFFGKFAPRSRVKEAVNAMLAAREFSFVQVSGRSMLEITPEKEVAVFTPRPAEEREKLRQPFGKDFSAAVAAGRTPGERAGSERSRSERDRSDRGRSDRKFDRTGSARTQFPKQARPAWDRKPAEKPAGERPAADGKLEERKPGERPDSGARSGRKNSGRPQQPGRTSLAKPFGRRPSSGRPSSGRPSSGRSSHGRPASGRPSSGRGPSNRPPSNRPPSNRPPS